MVKQIPKDELDKLANRLHCDYMDNVFAYVNRTMAMDPYTGERKSPDEQLMRDIEEYADIPEQAADDFRRQMAAFAGHLAHKNQTFWWNSNPTLGRAILEYLNVRPLPEIEPEKRRYRSVTDNWEPAW